MAPSRVEAYFLQPDNVAMLDPPYSRGPFPLFSTQHYEESLPQSILAERGLFVPTDSKFFHRVALWHEAGISICELWA